MEGEKRGAYIFAVVLATLAGADIAVASLATMPALRAICLGAAGMNFIFALLQIARYVAFELKDKVD